VGSSPHCNVGKLKHLHASSLALCHFISLHSRHRSLSLQGTSAYYRDIDPLRYTTEFSIMPSPAATYLDTEYQSTHYNLFKDSITVPLKSVLPPGVIRDGFDKAIRQYKDVVGDDQVYQGDELKEYIDPYELHELEGTRRMPSAAVRPKNVEELRGVVNISNDFGIPVWTFSRGKNLGYVNSIIQLSGKIVLNARTDTADQHLA
jgi:hypothetical protein